MTVTFIFYSQDSTYHQLKSLKRNTFRGKTAQNFFEIEFHGQNSYALRNDNFFSKWSTNNATSVESRKV